jgi:hypothetical protein
VIKKNKIKIEILLLVLIVFAYFIISYLLIRQRNSLWYDELYTLDIVKSDLSRTVLLIVGDGKPPLYYVLVYIYSNIVGTLSTDLLRFSSALLGVPFIIYVYKLCKEFIKHSFILPFIITLLLATNPLFLSYSIEYRGYTLLASAAVVFLYYFYKSVILKDSKFNSKYLYSKVFLLLTSYVTIFLLGAELLYKIITSKVTFSLKRIIIENKIDILILGIAGVIIELQTNIFPNFYAGWVPAIDIKSFFNSVLILFLGTDAGKSGKSYPFNINNNDSNLLVYSICFYVLIVILIYIFGKVLKSDLKKLFVILVINLFIVLGISIEASPIKFYLERYVIGILLSLLLVFLLSVSEVSKKLFYIVAILVLAFNTLFVFNILTRNTTFVETDPKSQEYIDYYTNYKLYKCGVNVFERKRINCPPD